MNKSRLEAFSDGVFSIVMTLLVLDIKLPTLADPTTEADLWRGVVSILSWPRLGSTSGWSRHR